MNSDKIEQASITKLKDSLDRCSRLKHDIRDNDKTPSWDGEIQVYRSSNFSCSTLYGLARIQVKGKHIKDMSIFEQQKIKFSVKIADLQNYQSDGGVVYFVIHIFDFDHYKIYYNALLPLDISNWLKVANIQKTVSIEFVELPFRDSEEMERILFNFLNDRKKQFGALVTIPENDAEKASMFSKFSGFSFGMMETDDPFDYMLKHPIYIYGNTFCAKVPLHRIQAEEISTTLEMPVKIEDCIYYSSVTIKKTEYDEIFCFGHCFELSALNKSIVFQESGNLEVRWTAINFLEHLNRHKQLYIGESYFGLDSLDFVENDALKKHFEEVKCIRSALKYFGVTQPLECKTSDKTSDKNLRILVAAYKNDGIVSFQAPVDGIHCCMEIENIRVLIHITHLYDLMYKLESGFSAPIKNCELRYEDDVVPCSIFCILNQHDFETIANVDYTALISDLMSYPLKTLYADKLLWLLLEMLKAFDTTKDEKLLSACQSLSLYLKSESDHAEVTNTLNYLQCVKRERPLTGEEKNVLYALRASERETSTQLGIAILLENAEDVAYYFSQLSEAEQTAFLDYPIASLSNQLMPK